MKKNYFISLIFVIFSLTSFHSQITIDTEAKDLNHFPGTDPQGMAKAGNHILLSLDTEYGKEPYKYNTETHNLEMIQDLYTYYSDGMIKTEFYKMGDHYYFLGTNNGNLQLWSVNPENFSLQKIKDFGDYFSNNYKLSAVVAENKIFIKYYNELYVSDGTTNGSFKVADVPYYTQQLVALKDEVFFVGSDAQTGNELWKSDGTLAGTHIVKDINTGYGSAIYYDEENLVAVNNKIIFNVNNYPTKNGLYVTDGTAEGTSFLMGPYTNFPENKNFYAKDKMLFTLGSQLWSTDGTASGTQSLYYTIDGFKNFFQFKNQYFITTNKGVLKLDEEGNISNFDYDNMPLEAVGLSDQQNYLVFKDKEPTVSKILISNGTMLTKTDINYANENHFVELDNRVVFSGYTEYYSEYGYDHQTNKELFYYDVSGHYGLEKDGNTKGSSYPRFFHKLNDDVFFVAMIGSTDQLFKIDRNNDIQQMGNLNFTTPYNWIGYHPVISSGDYIYFISNTLIRSNGTSEGTEQIALPANEEILEVYPLSNTTVLVKTFNDLHGFMRLWSIDTDATNFNLLTEMPSDYYSSSNNEEFQKVGNFIYFKMMNISRTELWKSDGSVANTKKVVDLPSFYFQKIFNGQIGNKLFFINITPDYAEEDQLNYLDTNNDEVHFVAQARSYINPENSFILKNELYFYSINASTGYYMNKTDGTAAGTTVIKSIPNSVNKSFKCGDYVYLNILSSSQYDHLYRTDGTAEGTFAVAPEEYYSTGLACVQGEMYFRSGDEEDKIYLTNGQPGNKTEVNFKSNGQTLAYYFYKFEGVDDRFFISKDFNNLGIELFVSEVITAPLSATETGNSHNTKKIVIYPNPAKTDINIQMAKGEQLLKVEIFDASGKLVMQSYRTSINVERLQTGIYFIKVATNSNIYSAKLIKN